MRPRVGPTENAVDENAASAGEAMSTYFAGESVAVASATRDARMADGGDVDGDGPLLSIDGDDDGMWLPLLRLAARAAADDAAVDDWAVEAGTDGGARDEPPSNRDEEPSRQDE